MATETHDYRADIDGLRAVAVLAVVAYHAFPNRVHGGFVGVDVFFVISGFLISGVILAGIERGTFTVRDFYARRIRRIFPALSVVLAVTLLVGAFVLLPNEYASLGKHVIAGAAFVLNFVLWKEAGYFDRAAEVKPLLHLWSLGIEEQFYLVWPVLLFLVKRMRVRVLFVIVPIAIASFVLSVLLVRTDTLAAFYSPAGRLWELAIGGVLAASSRDSKHATPWTSSVLRNVALRNVASGIGLALILGAILTINKSSPFPGFFALMPVFGTALVIAAGPRAWINRRVLSNRVAVLLGLVSYPLYLWHWPALSFARIIAADTPAVRLVLVALSFVAAWLTYRFVERPIRRGNSGRAVRGLAAAMVFVAACGLAIIAANGFPSRVPAPLRAYAAADYDYETDARLGTCWLTLDDAPDAYAPSCLDARGPAPLVFVWGDSHAARLYPGVRRVLGDAARSAQYTRNTCPPLVDLGYPSCVNANDFVLAKIRAEHPDTVILYAVWHHYGTFAPDSPEAIALDLTIRAVKALGVHNVIVLGPAPQWDDALPRLLMNVALRDRGTFTVPSRLAEHLDPNATAGDASMSALLCGRTDVTYVSAWKTFCDDTGCLALVSEDGTNALTTWDYGHLTTPGAAYLARRLSLPR